MYAAINEGFLWAKESTDTLKIYYFDDVRVKKKCLESFPFDAARLVNLWRAAYACQMYFGVHRNVIRN